MAPPPSRFWGRAGRRSARLAPKPPGDQNQKSNLEGALFSFFGGWTGSPSATPSTPNIFLPSLRPFGPRGGGIHIKSERSKSRDRQLSYNSFGILAGGESYAPEA